MNSTKFTGKEGKLISAEDAQKFTLPYQEREREILARGENYVKAEFFGIHTFNELIKIHGDECVGFRAYYGLSQEDDLIEEKSGKYTTNEKKATSRIILVPVDAYGNDMTVTAQLGGMKDMPARREAMSGGPMCPSDC